MPNGHIYQLQISDNNKVKRRRLPAIEKIDDILSDRCLHSTAELSSLGVTRPALIRAFQSGSAIKLAQFNLNVDFNQIA
jgi:hypothetical protein